MSNGKTRRAYDYRYGGSTFTAHELYAESKCPQCGKTFRRTSEHVYKRNDGGVKYYCSYTCFRVKAREDEEKEREKFQRECEMLEHQREREARYREIKRLTKGELVKIRSKADAEVRLEVAKLKIREYRTKWLSSTPGTNERYQFRKNMTRWERKYAYIGKVLAEYEKEEQEA